ncbi:MAG TPA: DUF4331 family protein [Pyrinomonadaceae bacterium]|jgi:hypothetical protein
MSRAHTRRIALVALALTTALAIFVTPAPDTGAADHGDAPYVNGDQSVDGADTYAFLDPTDNTRVILAMTVRGFIAPGENRNFGQFDPQVRHRFEIDINGDPRPDRFINIQFAKRTGSTAPQVATIELPDGSVFTANSTPPSTCLAGNTGCPPAPTITSLGSTGVLFFAGMRDDSFNFDIPAFGNFVNCVTGSPAAGETCPNPVTNIFQRGRDSFAGYNIMNIALSIPRAYLTANGAGNSIGVQAVHQRRSPTLYPGSPDVVAAGTASVGFGRWQTLDRVGNPGINAVIMPFVRKEEYNAATPQDDANGRFANSIVGVLNALGTNTTNINILASVVVSNGDLLRLNLNTPNTSLGAGEEIYSTSGYAGFPNGRRPGDDVVDTLLFFVANQPSGGISDNANVNEVPFLSSFPFFAPPHQPRPASAGAEDQTRN